MSIRVRDLALGATARPLAAAVRGPQVESVHLGHLVVTDPRGDVVAAVGDADARVWPRSSLKPLQAVALVQAGLDLADAPDLLALVAASHSGQARHVEGALAILARAGLDASALRNTPDLPLDPDAALAWRAAGRGPERIVQNCSGKHAGMVATSAARGWDLAGYLDLSHPVQRQVRATTADLTGYRGSETTVDGCGAPLLSLPLAGLARAFGRIALAGADAAAGGAAAGTAEAAVARAMGAHPLMVGGDGRDVSALLAGVDGLVVKDGAEGVCAAGLPDGTGIALKVLDGADRARRVVIAAVLRALGVASEPADLLDGLATAPVLGHGRPVGALADALGEDVVARLRAHGGAGASGAPGAGS